MLGRLRKILTRLYTMSLIQLLNELLYPFHLTQSTTSFLDYVFNPGLSLACLLQFFFICFKNHFIAKITDNNVHGMIFFTLLIAKTSPDHILHVSFSKKYFWILIFSNGSKSEFRISLIMWNTSVNIGIHFDNRRFHFECSICFVIFVNFFI